MSAMGFWYTYKKTCISTTESNLFCSKFTSVCYHRSIKSFEIIEWSRFNLPLNVDTML